MNQIALGRTGQEVVIQQAPGVWAVTYQGQIITGYRSSVVESGQVYLRTMFPGPGHARVLAQKLNRIFHCEDFDWIEMTQLQETD